MVSNNLYCSEINNEEECRLQEEVINSDTIFNVLNERDKEILLQMAKGFTSREISHVLCIENSSVDSRRNRLKEKLGIENSKLLMKQAVKYAAYVEELSGGGGKNKGDK